MKILDIITESHNRCPHCGGPLVSESELMEKKDACYYKIKSSAKVWPSAYASGRLVQCRKKGAANYGNKSESMAEGIAETLQQQQVRAAITKGMAKWDQSDLATYKSQPTNLQHWDPSGWASGQLKGINSIDPDGTVVIELNDTTTAGLVKKLAALGGMPGVKTRQLKMTFDPAKANANGVTQGDVAEGLTEIDNRTPSGDREEQRRNRPEAKAKQDKEQQKRLKDTSPEMRKKLRLPEPKEGMAEGFENNNTTAQKIFFARSNKAPKEWSYDHVGFITQDGKQIQMSGHKGNDVYVTNDVTDDPEFPKQNIKIVSLSKPVSVPTTNSVGAENCGTFVANVLQANGIKGIDTQKIYSVFKKPQPQEQGVAEGVRTESAELAKQYGWAYNQGEYGASMTHPKHGRISLSSPVTSRSGDTAVEREWTHNNASGIGDRSLAQHLQSLKEQGMTEAKDDYVPPKEADYGPEYQAMVRRVGEKARAQEKAKQQPPKAPVRESRLALLKQIIQS